jgi:fucose 4-O-acetylase-like acetyltransferase
MTSPRNVTLDLLRVIGMFFVMLNHSPGDPDIKTAPGIFFLKGFLVCGAVPVFFLLSGYFGARRIDSTSLSAKDYVQEKARTLIIPFLFWNAAVLLLVLLAKYAGWDSSFRGGGAYFDVNFSALSIGSALTGIGRLPIVYQFWFLRDLIVVVFVAFLLCRHVPKIPLLPWFFFLIPLPMASSLGYYLLGHELHSYLPPEQFPSFRSSILYCAGWSLMGIGVIAGIIAVPRLLQEIGSAAFIFMLTIVASRSPFVARISALGPAVFFVYATHEPLQTIISKEWQSHHLPAYGTLFCFLLIPTTVFAVCAVAYVILRKISPGPLAFATGGR